MPHQWPEWETFLEMLKAKGHFDGAASGKEEVDEGGGGGAAVNSASADFNRVKIACLTFARERFDLLRFLSVLPPSSPASELRIPLAFSSID